MPLDPPSPTWDVRVDPDAAPGDVLPPLARLLLALTRERLKCPVKPGDQSPSA
jgi:hypothetical protein